VIEYTVQEGDCLASIADAHGLTWQTLWNLPENSELRRRHEEPTILLPGEVVRIPELRVRRETGATEQRHRFVRRATPAVLRLRILRPAQSDRDQQPAEGQSSQAQTSEGQPGQDELLEEQPPEDEPLNVEEEDPTPEEQVAEEPWANAPYALIIDSRMIQGQTDDDGRLEERIPPTARRGRLKMEPGTPRERVYELRLGGLDPITSITGLADRLNNLGYHDGTRPAEMDAGLEESIRAFQRANGLEETGRADQSTQDRLRELHGSYTRFPC
jgi:hypothetical protein